LINRRASPVCPEMGLQTNSKRFISF
jgi:hypothetical protein